MSESQKLTRMFIKLFIGKASSDTFIKQLAVSKSLLKKYDFNDLVCLLEYLHEFPIKEGIRSLAYIPYIYDKTIVKAKRYKISKDFVVEEKIEREQVIVQQKIIKNKKSLFKNDKTF